MRQKPSRSAPSTTSDTLYTPRELAFNAKVSIKTIRRLIERKTLRSYRIGNQLRISEADWKAYLEGDAQ